MPLPLSTYGRASSTSSPEYWAAMSRSSAAVSSGFCASSSPGRSWAAASARTVRLRCACSQVRVSSGNGMTCTDPWSPRWPRPKPLTTAESPGLAGVSSSESSEDSESESESESDSGSGSGAESESEPESGSESGSESGF